MRTEKEMFQLFNEIVESDDRIRVYTLEGSRVNPNVTPDKYQDYDITFLVSDVESFTQNDDWLSVFGDIVFMQKPEAMTLFPADFPSGWFSYLMLFSDGVRIDLTLVPLSDASNYFKNDPLVKILMNKESGLDFETNPSDEPFWIQEPSFQIIHDSSNEFYLSISNVAKGLLRNELLYSNWLFDHIVRTELIRMLNYLAGTKHGFPINTGKFNKWLPKFLSDLDYQQLLKTYELSDIQNCWTSLYKSIDLFDKALSEVCVELNYVKPNHTEVIRAYIETLKGL